MMHLVTLQILVLPLLPLLFLLGVLAPGMRDVGAMYFQAFFRAEQADQLLLHLQLPRSCMLQVLKSRADRRTCRDRSSAL